MKPIKPHLVTNNSHIMCSIICKYGDPYVRMCVNKKLYPKNHIVVKFE